MNKVFPLVSTIKIRDAEPGSVVKLPRVDHPMLALVTDHVTNNARSIVLLNANIQHRPAIMFAESWPNEETALRYDDPIRFELGMEDKDIDSRGNKSWEAHGVIVLIGKEFYIRAAPQDDFYGSDKLVNIRNGSVFSDHPPNNLWSFLAWQICLKDVIADRDVVLTKFSTVISHT